MVVVESSATVPSFKASTAVPLGFSSTSGVLGGAAFGTSMISAWSELSLESRSGSGVPLVIGSGVDDLGGSGVGVRALLISGVGVVALGTVGLGSGLGLGARFGSAGLRSALGSGIGVGLSLTSAGLETSNFASSGWSGVFSGAGMALVSATGLGLISKAGGVLGLDSAADGGLGLVSGATEIVTAADSEI